MIGLLVAFAVAVCLTGAMLPVLRRFAMDVPNHRSSHVKVTPRGGGASVMLAAAAAVVVVGGFQDAGAILLSGLALGVVGLADDVRSLAVTVRFVAQLLVFSALVVTLLPTDELPLWAPLVALLSVVGSIAYTNAYNFMDGVNGMSGLNAAVSGAWFWWAGHHWDVDALRVLGPVVLGAALGFLVWNARGSVFLGDVGSYGIGALLAGLAVTGWTTGIPGAFAVAPFLVYLADTGWALLRRWRGGRRLSEAHREHVYQRLVDARWSHAGSSMWTAGAAAVICVLAATPHGLDRGIALVGVLLVLITYLSSPALFAGETRVP